MTELIDHGVFLTESGALKDFKDVDANAQIQLLQENQLSSIDDAKKNTIAHQIMSAHNRSKNPAKMEIVFDSLVMHDITYVGIIQSARASGMTEFPVPAVLTNCHNSLCAVGGTINEDDHVFGLSAAKKYGGIYVPAHFSIIHQYAREMMSACGSMILGSDSHTRYGCFGTMGVGEGGPELVKQLLQNTYDVNTPEVVLIWLEGEPRLGVGPHDVAIELVRAVFKNGFVKNKVLEFAGPGVSKLSMDFRTGIDVMTTETTCLSSIWITDEKVKDYFQIHGRPDSYKELKPAGLAYYDAMIRIDLSKIESMIALPFHPSNALPIKELLQDPQDILRTVELEAEKQFGKKAKLDLLSKVMNGGILADQGIIAGCAGGMFENISIAADIMKDQSIGDEYFTMSVYPSSMPVNAALTENGVIRTLQENGVVNKTAFCGPCFGAGDVPVNNGLSIRHTTRNFPNREGSKPDQGQISVVALMDARSIAATAANKGFITAATECDFTVTPRTYHYDKSIYARRVYNGFHHAQANEALRLGPNITDWPTMLPLSENLLLELAAVIQDPVTTTDELIPSGETSSYRSNPLKLAEFTLSRREPAYVNRAKAIRDMELNRQKGNKPQKLVDALNTVCDDLNTALKETSVGSAVFANKPGDGSAREQAASCQKVLGGAANIAREYATKRYRSNCINWGIIPFTISAETPFNYEAGSYVFIPDIRKRLIAGEETFPATVISPSGSAAITLNCGGLTSDEKQILLDGCLMNFYAAKKAAAA